MTMVELSGGVLVRAIHVFLDRAYANAEIPINRRHFAELQSGCALETVLRLAGVEHLPPSSPGTPPGYSFRVGNTRYPHMKMTVRPVDSDEGFVFAVETHDHFEIAADHPEFNAVCELRQYNSELARCIEQAWETADLPTQNALLRRHLGKQ